EAEKEALAQDLISLYKERLKYFPQKTEAADIYIDVAQTMYDYNIGTKEEQFQAFDKAYKEDVESFNAKSFYTYFTLLVDLQDAGKKSLQDVFDLYDEISASVEVEENALAEGLAALIEKQEAGTELDEKEKNKLSAFETNLKAYSTIKGAINAKLGQRADCENLIPLYNKDFDSKKSNVEWLKRAAGRLSAKDCTDDPLFFKLVEALHQAEPSAKSALYLGQLAAADGNSSKALEYYNQSAELETNASDKARVYMMIANNYKEKGSFSQARNYYRRALDAKPSLGRAYLHIANMYAQSVNNCGDTPFNKRAVYWLAADMAAKAGRVDPSLASTASETAAAYRGRAPQRSEIFTADMQGKTITIGCWIGQSVRVPNL
ncbi:MAG TPA: tetratricopeptide repeat protein, partial [Salinimicrobium sp.]|nr:tetratricopeptide repeat protein [Salinimicrobium sp.]